MVTAKLRPVQHHAVYVCIAFPDGEVNELIRCPRVYVGDQIEVDREKGSDIKDGMEEVPASIVVWLVSSQSIDSFAQRHIPKCECASHHAGSTSKAQRISATWCLANSHLRISHEFQ